MQCIKKCISYNLTNSKGNSSNTISTYYQNTLRFLPPLTITNDEIDMGFERLDKAVATITA